MFTAGTQMRGLVNRTAVRTVAAVATAGLIIPFVAGVVLFTTIDLSRYEGTAHNHDALLLVFAIGLAVTSIPVISRIMMDLGILRTRFARIVLSVAVIEDIVLYVVLAVAIGLVQVPGGAQFGLAGAVGLEPGSSGNMAYHSFATVGFLIASLACGPWAYRLALRSRFNIVKRQNPIGFQLLVLLVFSSVCLLLSIVPLFGAFVAGVVVATAPGTRAELARTEISHVALGLFIPVYFAIVGLQLDLVDHFDPLPFVAFLAFACVAESLSVYAAARLAGEARSTGFDLAVAMNARGGPGIVLASTAYAAGIIDATFYTSLVMLAVVTSLIAGAWL